MAETLTRCDDYIKWASSRLPELATTRDLIDIGFYRSIPAAAAARRNGYAPEHFKVNERLILYPKQAILDFLRLTKVSRMSKSVCKKIKKGL